MKQGRKGGKEGEKKEGGMKEPIKGGRECGRKGRKKERWKKGKRVKDGLSQKMIRKNF